MVYQTRPVKKIIIHCTATDINKYNNFDSIDADHKSRGWDGFGYNYLIRRSGLIEIGRPHPPEAAGAHCKGHNKDSIGICLAGRKYFDDRQLICLAKLCSNLMQAYQLLESDIYPHSHFNHNKTCPNFSWEKWKSFYLRGLFDGYTRLEDDEETKKKDDALLTQGQEF